MNAYQLWILIRLVTGIQKTWNLIQETGFKKCISHDVWPQNSVDVSMNLKITQKGFFW